jgi:hypothetical protein
MRCSDHAGSHAVPGGAPHGGSPAGNGSQRAVRSQTGHACSDGTKGCGPLTVLVAVTCSSARQPRSPLAGGPDYPPSASAILRWTAVKCCLAGPCATPSWPGAGQAIAGWFGRFPAGTESREDTYLLDPQLRGLAVKIRGGGALEVKAHRGAQGSWRWPAAPAAPEVLAEVVLSLSPRPAATRPARRRYVRGGASASSHAARRCADHCDRRGWAVAGSVSSGAG